MATLHRAPAAFVLLAALIVCGAGPAHAQLPSEPFVIGDGRVVVSGDMAVTASCAHASGSAACASDPGYFNYSDYDTSTLRMLRLGLSTSVRISRQIAALGEVRMENAHAPRPYGAYVRFRPFERADFDIQAGRIPSTFGAFARHAYSTDNLLIGYPLAYQYLLSLRSDAVPLTTDDLIRMRGRGWLSTFPAGNQEADAGLPIANAFRWDTGVQAHGSLGWLELAGSVSNGSLTRPLFRDDNSGKQVAARLAARPMTGLVLGVSASHAPYVSRAAASLAHVDGGGFTQQVFGADAEFSRDHYIVRFEALASQYELATLAPRLRAVATMVEGRYKLTPRTHVAARLDHLGFNTVTGTSRSATWEAPVTRWEIGGGVAVQRNLQLRIALQHNSRDGGRVQTVNAVATQLLYWF